MHYFNSPKYVSMNYRFLFLLSLFFYVNGQAQNDSATLRKLHDEIMLHGKTYENLRYLCKNIGPRLSGSENAQKAVLATSDMLWEAGADTVYLQPVMVPHWVRGPKEVAIARVNGQSRNLHSCALGMSIGTPADGLSAEVVAVPDFAALERMPDSEVKGKIVFFNYAMRPDLPFGGYGDAVKYRGGAPAAAAKKGAIATVIRSVTHALDYNPHTGSTRYEEGVPKIPAFAISTLDADWLYEQAQGGNTAELFLKSGCEHLPDALSYNVIAEMRGTEKPEEIVLAGGHLDSWDLGEGAHDDASGCVQSIEVIRAFKALGIRPKRTVRVVMYMNEENGVRGGNAYADSAKNKKENHIYAIESDAGGFGVQTIGVSGTARQFEQAKKWEKYFPPYGIHSITRDGGGVDITPLRPHGTALSSINPLSQRYFDFHHAPNDVFEAVHKRELELGAFGMAAMVYLVSTYGLPK